MEEGETLLDSIFDEEEEGEYLGDVEMLDAETIEDSNAPAAAAAVEVVGGNRGGEEGEIAVAEGDSVGDRSVKKSKKKKKKSRKNRKGPLPPSDQKIADINRFVINTCRHLKERKSYLVWNAVGCLGLAAVSDLIKEVDAIQACGGQQTTDGRRPRNGGGILWNILKTRDPKAYKEIMAKGREFEKQFRKQSKTRTVSTDKEDSPSPRGPPVNNELAVQADQTFDGPQQEAEVQSEPAQSSSNGERVSVLSRIRVPVAYDDLFEEGEIGG